ncbi:winged helix-turn-helix transcriptional regulator [Methanolobus sp. ZRKC3]|uniref:winged helix-turn-helix transcriptional regulator n=1 Tax=Methanolobus sp. ZRKC3 TaxID=3125786 RepID=UPI003248107C
MEFELDTRKRIFEAIQEFPGIHLRELERKLGIAVGNLQYHLHYMEEHNIISSLREEQHVRYFVRDRILDESDKNILSLLRRKACRHILVHLMKMPGMNNKELASAIGLSPSTISWHLNKLIAAGILEKKKCGRTSKYEITDPSKVAGLMISYKGSFLDRLLDNFIEVWEMDAKKK